MWFTDLGTLAFNSTSGYHAHHARAGRVPLGDVVEPLPGRLFDPRWGQHFDWALRVYRHWRDFCVSFLFNADDARYEEERYRRTPPEHFKN